MLDPILLFDRAVSISKGDRYCVVHVEECLNVCHKVSGVAEVIQVRPPLPDFDIL